MKTLVTTLYMSTATQITIDLEFQFQISNKATGTITNTVFVNDDTDFGNIRVNPYFKFIHTYFDENRLPVRSKPIYLSAYHLFDLKASLAKTLKLLDDPKSFVKQEDGTYKADENAKRASHWAIRDIGKEEHYMTMVLYPYYKKIVDPATETETRTFEPGVAFSMSTMPKDSRGKPQAVLFSKSELKAIYTVVSSIDVTNLTVMGGMIELFDQKYKALAELIKKSTIQPVGKQAKGSGYTVTPSPTVDPAGVDPLRNTSINRTTGGKFPPGTVVTTTQQAPEEISIVNETPEPVVVKPVKEYGGLPARSEAPAAPVQEEFGFTTDSVDEAVEDPYDADAQAIDDIFDTK